MSLVILGVGPGDKKYILPIVSKTVEKSSLVIGNSRLLRLFALKDKKVFDYKKNFENVIEKIKSEYENEKIALLVSGDTGIFSLTSLIKSKLNDLQFDVIPGLSSVSYFCGKIKIKWEDITLLSCHGREINYVFNELRDNGKLIVFSGKNTVKELSKELIKKGYEDLSITVGENLSYENERIIEGKPKDFLNENFDDLALIYIENKLNEYKWRYNTIGIPDNLFERAKVPMTKEEIRVVSISKLKLFPKSVIYDIGAGTGSVSIECALKSSNSIVYAIEKNIEAVNLIMKNIEKFKAYNIEIVHGLAPDIFNKLIEPDRVFIGGCGGNTKSTLIWIKKIDKNIKVVINTITIESLSSSVRYLEEFGYKNIEIVNISVSKNKKIKNKNLMIALNPVYIISADSR